MLPLHWSPRICMPVNANTIQRWLKKKKKRCHKRCGVLNFPSGDWWDCLEAGVAEKMRVLFIHDLFFSFVATWLCSVDGFSCRCRPMVLPYIGSAKRQARVCPSQVLVDSRYRHERVQRGVVCGERKGRREGRESSRCDAVVLAAAVACMLRFNRVHFVSLLWSSPKLM